ncbi:MAG: hypothetical protein AAF626_15650 [Pseudomonadota bacterium]
MPQSDLARALAPGTPDPWRALAALSAALLVVMLLWAVSGDPRVVSGGPVWAKPMKFAASFLVLFATIALVADRLSPPVRDGWPLRLIGLGMAVAMIAEMAWIVRQAARGADSHYNSETPFEALMYTTVMAGGAVYLVIAIGLIGWIAKRDPGARFGPATREGVWLGFVASFVLTLVVAGWLSNGSGPYEGVHPPGGATIPIMGWSGVTGDLRPAHFLALHAMQALPLLGLWLDRMGAARGIRSVRLATGAWVAATALLFVQAITGHPLIALG